MVKIIKNKNLLFFAFLITFIFLGANYVSALEVRLPGLAENPTIGDYVSYVFGTLIMLAGLLALISFVIGAVGLINPNLEAHNDAKDRMKGAVLGLALTLSSYILMQTINPKFLTPSLEALPTTSGVYYFNGKDKFPVGQTEINVANRSQVLRDGKFDSLLYDCPDDGTEQPALLIWRFPNAGLEKGNGDLSKVTVARRFCGEKEPISNLGSFKWDFEKPGVYFCLGSCGGGNMCSGYMSGAYRSSQDKILDPFNKNLKGLRIVNDTTNKIFYGALLHQVAGLKNGGLCTTPKGVAVDPTNRPEFCYSDATISPSAVDIFRLNADTGSSGDGVTFYSEPFSDLTDANAGFFNVLDKDIEFPFSSFRPTPTNCQEGPHIPSSSDANSLDMCFDYTNISQPKEYKEKYTTFSSRPGSIKIKGSYLVAIYSAGSYCQTFTKDVPNLKAEPLTKPGSSKDLNKVYIIPIK